MGHVVEKFANSWLSRYLRPNRCVHDNGMEFVGSEFIRLLAQMGVKDVCMYSSLEPTIKYDL